MWSMNYKNLAILVFLLLFTDNLVSALANGWVVSGRVTDSEGNILVGASVTLKGTLKGVTTDVDGFYRFPGISTGVNQLRFSFIGYETGTRELVIISDTIVNVALVRLPVIIDDVVITATRAGNRSPLAFTNVDRTIIEKLDPARDIPFLLSLTPSFVETSESGNGVGYTGMRIRGTDASRVNVTIDGIPLNDPESQQVFWVDLPDLSSSVDNIQVQRGVGTSTNGAGAFGASINIQTLGIENEAFARINSTAGSFRTFKNSISAGTGLLKNKFAFQTRFSDVKSDGYIRRTGSDHQSAFFSGIYRSARGLLRANIILGKQKTGIGWWGVPGEMLEKDRRYNPAGEYTDDEGRIRYYENETDNYTQNHYQLIYSRNLTADVSLNSAVHYTRGSGYYEEYKEDEKYSKYGLDNIRIGDSTISSTDLIRRKWMSNDFFGFVSSMKYKSEKVETSLGGGLNFYSGDHFGRLIWMNIPGRYERDHQWYFNNGEKTDGNAYAKITMNLTTAISLFGDVQYRHVRYSLTGVDSDLKNIGQAHRFNFINPKAGMFIAVAPDQEAYFSVAVAHREPSRTDFKEASGDDKATPRAESLLDIESGYRLILGKSSFSANLYGMFYKDQLVPTGELSSVGNPIMTNVPQSYRIGAEITTVFTPFRFLSWDLNLTISRNKIEKFVEYYVDYNTNDWSSEYRSKNPRSVDIAYSPRVIGTGDLAFRPLKSLDIHLVSKYVGSQYFDNTMSRDRKLDPYFVNNLVMGFYPVIKNLKKVEIQAILNNFLNVKYSSNAYGGNWYEDGREKTWAYYFPQAGINYLFRMGFMF